MSLMVVGALLGPLAAAGSFPASSAGPAPSPETVVAGLGEAERLALNVPAIARTYFVENVGQLPDDRIRFYQPSGNPRIAFAEGSVYLSLASPDAASVPKSGRASRAMNTQATGEARRMLVEIVFEGARNPIPAGRGVLPHRSNFFLGKDPAEWRTGATDYGEVAYEGLYEGIDLVYRATERGVKYEFLIRPGADLGVISMRYEGVEGIELDEDGSLLVRTATGELRDSAPVGDQEGREVSCRFVPVAPRSVAFECPGRDVSHTLLIDPLVYSTFLGGSSFDFTAPEGTIATDSSGNAYVTGTTWSLNFPVTPGAYDNDLEGIEDAFVAKLNPSGSNPLLFATYLGGGADDVGGALAVDSSGQVYVTGTTFSTDFPTTPDGDTSLGGSLDAFVAKLSNDGSALLYGTYLGGSNGEYGTSIAIDNGGCAYVTGLTDSTDFPTTPNAFDRQLGGANDAFVAKLDPMGSATPLYGTYLGGNGDGETGYSIAVDAASRAYVVGYTFASDFPTTPGAFQIYIGGGRDAFVTKLNPEATQPGLDLVYSTFLGGSDQDQANSIALDVVGNAYVVGLTKSSSNFPTVTGSYDTTYNGGPYDAFVTKLNAAGTALFYSTYLGGSALDEAESVAVAEGKAYVTGRTLSSDFPTTPDALDTTYNGNQDVFFARLDPPGSALVFSTYFGGAEQDEGHANAVNADGCWCATGDTLSPDFPVTLGAHDTHLDGQDAFVLKMGSPRLKDEVRKEWYVNTDTMAASVYAADVDGDSKMEILTAGFRDAATPDVGGRNGRAELRIWRWDGSDLVLEKDKEWPPNDPSVAYAVRAGNVDNDLDVEIVTAGYVIQGGVRRLDVRVWRWDGMTDITPDGMLPAETRESVAHSVALFDANANGRAEIYVAGMVASGSGGYKGLLQIYEWSPGGYVKRAESTWGNPSVTTEGMGIAVGEANAPPSPPYEVVVGGYTTVSGHLRAQVELWQWDAYAVTLIGPWEKPWFSPDGDVDVTSVYLGDVDGDVQLEIVTAGLWTALNGQQSELRILHWTGSGLDFELPGEKYTWRTGDSSHARSVYAANVDGDAAVEILVAGFDIGGSDSYAGLAIFTWNDATDVLTTKANLVWADDGAKHADGVFALDVEPESVVEILVAGEAIEPTGRPHLPYARTGHLIVRSIVNCG